MQKNTQQLRGTVHLGTRLRGSLYMRVTGKSVALCGGGQKARVHFQFSDNLQHLSWNGCCKMSNVTDHKSLSLSLYVSISDWRLFALLNFRVGLKEAIRHDLTVSCICLFFIWKKESRISPKARICICVCLTTCFFFLISLCP